MSPLEMIKQGILQHNIELIRDGYEAMSGEKLEIVCQPDPIAELRSEIDQLINQRLSVHQEHTKVTKKGRRKKETSEIPLDELVKADKPLTKEDLDDDGPTVDIVENKTDTINPHTGKTHIIISQDTINPAEIELNKLRAQKTHKTPREAYVSPTCEQCGRKVAAGPLCTKCVLSKGAGQGL